jgi:hypothetical protein
VKALVAGAQAPTPAVVTVSVIVTETAVATGTEIAVDAAAVITTVDRQQPFHFSSIQKW